MCVCVCVCVCFKVPACVHLSLWVYLDVCVCASLCVSEFSLCFCVCASDCVSGGSGCVHLSLWVYLGVWVLSKRTHGESASTPGSVASVLTLSDL